MNNYIFFNDKSFKFFKAEGDCEAHHFVINHCDLSFEPAILKIYNFEMNNSKIISFNTKGELLALRLKKFFFLNGGGDGVFCFRSN